LIDSSKGNPPGGVTPEAQMLQNLRKLQLSEVQRDGMRAAGHFNAQLMDYLRGFVKAGISTSEIDRLAHDYTIQHRHTPATLGYLGYTKSCCTSVNDVICHGIPGDYVLKDGDIINVDITSIVDGWHGDQSETFLVGEVCNEARSVCQ
jgi:methionyl aminopeptidase